MDNKKLAEALLCCADRKCGVCPYRGCGIACKYRLMNDAATQLAEEDRQLEEMTQRNDENSGACKIFARRLDEQDKQLAVAKKRQAEFDDALREMVGQYCSCDGKLDHEFMIAGAKAFDALGLKNGAPTETLWRGPQGAGEVKRCLN